MSVYGNLSIYTNLHDTVVRAIWEEEEIITSPAASLFNIQTTSAARESTLGLNSLPLPEEFVGGIPYTDIDPGLRKDFIPKEYSQGLRIPMQFVEDDQNNIVRRAVEQLRDGFQRHAALNMSNVFNNAFTASTDEQKAADGKALCDASHTGHNNLGTSALSVDALHAARTTMRRFKDDEGATLIINPDTLLVPPELERTARTIVGSTLEPGSANNDINTLYSAVSIIVDSMLTDTDNWFLIDSRLARMHLMWFWRTPPQIETHPSSSFDRVMRTRGYMRYSRGFDYTAWIYGSQV